MPPYITNPSGNNPVTCLTPGSPAYAFGSKPTNVPTTKMKVTNVALASNVATVTVTVIEGNIPVVGELISINGTSNTSGLFNVANKSITAVSISSSTGQGTITFALSHADVVSAADAGLAYVPVPETAETATSGTKSQAFAIQNTIGRGYGISWAYNFPSAPVSASIQLEGAINDVDGEYTLIGSAQTVVNAYTEIFATLPELVNFVRLNLTALSGGTNPTIVGKILLS